MQPYSDAEIDEALERIAGDVARRFGIPEFHGPAMEALIDQLRRMEGARRGGDRTTALVHAETAVPALESYRPTNATSRSKAILVEITEQLIRENQPPVP